MSIKIQTHGGRCCGIKTIHGFQGYPNTVLGPKKGQKFHECTDVYGESVSKYYNFYRPKRPRETYLERFNEYLRYLAEIRPSGLVEVTMTDYQLGGCGWQQILKEKGFKQVSEFYNSNSGEKVYVFHLVYGQIDVDDYYESDDDYYFNEGNY